MEGQVQIDQYKHTIVYSTEGYVAHYVPEVYMHYLPTAQSIRVQQ